jgi:hypothetical protein
MTTFCYDLSRELISFDFYGWLVKVKSLGATEITFDTAPQLVTPWSPEMVRRRFESIIAPGPALLGLPSREGADGERLGVGCSRLGHLVKAAKLAPLPRLASVLRPGTARYTVTMRQQRRKSPFRNSNDHAWRIFAADIGAHVIEDYDVKPIHLHERMALYAGAEMNFGVSNGPMVMCSLSAYPCMSFCWGRGSDQREVLRKYGMPYGTNAPWCGVDQFTYWADDDLGTIRRHFQVWKEHKNGNALSQDSKSEARCDRQQGRLDPQDRASGG